MTFDKPKYIASASKASKALQTRWKDLAAKKIVRKGDGRIDFFFSGILLSFGVTASALLGLSGFGLYKAVFLATRYIKHARST